MYSEGDIDAAVASGALSQAAATALRRSVAERHAAPIVDEEHFRLVTGFNDIFVTIAVVLLLVALAQLGARVAVGLGGAGVAVASWLLAEYFTARRRMALPSIVLLLTFVGGVAGTLVGILVQAAPHLDDRTGALTAAGIALVTAGAAWLHWRRFAVPITVAAGATALVGVAVALLLAAVPAAADHWSPLVLVAGLAMFAFAMRWDLSDRERVTRRSDVAFWLHLAAAPMIAHPVFQMLGVFGGDLSLATAAVVLVLYLFFAVVALAVDRRALLVSGLAYVLYAMGTLLRGTGAIEVSAALTGLVIGSALLTLSAFWQPMRRRVVEALGDLGQRLPPVAPPLAPPVAQA